MYTDRFGWYRVRSSDKRPTDVFQISNVETIHSLPVQERPKEINSSLIIKSISGRRNRENKKMVYILLTFTGHNQMCVACTFRTCCCGNAQSTATHRTLLCPLIHFIRTKRIAQRKISIIVESYIFTTRNRNLFSMLFSLWPTDTELCVNRKRFSAGFLLLMWECVRVCVCVEHLICSHSVTVVHGGPLVGAIFIDHLFIYCQANFKRCPVSISLKGNDIPSYSRFVIERMVNILCHLSVVVLGFVLINLIK